MLTFEFSGEETIIRGEATVGRAQWFIGFSKSWLTALPFLLYER